MPTETQSRLNPVFTGEKFTLLLSLSVSPLLVDVKGNYLASSSSSPLIPFSSSDVGTGLLLGGGLSFLSPAHGFAADLFKELDVVLVTGKIVTVTAYNEYSDLFRALKGGANRFGIVTRYELDAVHTGTKDDKRWFGGTLVVCSNHHCFCLVLIRLPEVPRDGYPSPSQCHSTIRSKRERPKCW